MCVCNCCCCFKRLAIHTHKSYNLTSQLKLNKAIESSNALHRSHMFKDKKLREIFIKLSYFLTSLRYFLCKLFAVMWKHKQKSKESTGTLPLFSNGVILSSDQTSREAEEESLPCYTCRLYKLTRYFTTKYLYRWTFDTLRLRHFLPTSPSTDIPVLSQMRCMLPVERYLLYRVPLILLKIKLTFCMTGPLLLLLLR